MSVLFSLMRAAVSFMSAGVSFPTVFVSISPAAAGDLWSCDLPGKEIPSGQVSTDPGRNEDGTLYRFQMLMFESAACHRRVDICLQIFFYMLQLMNRKNIIE